MKKTIRLIILSLAAIAVMEALLVVLKLRQAGVSGQQAAGDPAAAQGQEQAVIWSEEQADELQVSNSAGGFRIIRNPGADSYAVETHENQETDSDAEAETMKNTVLREFGEELLDYEEFLDLNTSDLLQRLHEILHPLFLGLGFEPLNTKTEVLSALVIDVEQDDDASLFGHRTKRSEFENLFGKNENYEGDIMLRPLTTAMLQQYENDSRSTASMKEMMRILAKKENRAIFQIEESAQFQY